MGAAPAELELVLLDRLALELPVAALALLHVLLVTALPLVSLPPWVVIILAPPRRSRPRRTPRNNTRPLTPTNRIIKTHGRLSRKLITNPRLGPLGLPINFTYRTEDGGEACCWSSSTKGMQGGCYDCVECADDLGGSSSMHVVAV